VSVPDAGDTTACGPGIFRELSHDDNLAVALDGDAARGGSRGVAGTVANTCCSGVKFTVKAVLSAVLKVPIVAPTGAMMSPRVNLSPAAARRT
jgi:hypothetical protein